MTEQRNFRKSPPPFKQKSLFDMFGLVKTNLAKRVGDSARDGDGDGGTNDVHAASILSSRLARPDRLKGVFYIVKRVWICVFARGTPH